ncbi:Hypothetical_protein [Hexamita inflata]|uniref:Hypothetical_protein n=1 Tax=Hexamita inflata TaxID=28002 RepID=A0AA86TG59_9EUKA|nr:Hypothetical protein HINF_LOCUS2927 [Hexamita inflata]
MTSEMLNMPNLPAYHSRKDKQTQILCSQYIAEISLLRVNEHEQEETDQRVMILFPALNLEALRVAADTLVPRFIPAIPKIVTKITSEVNNISSSAELGFVRFRSNVIFYFYAKSQSIITRPFICHVNKLYYFNFLRVSNGQQLTESVRIRYRYLIMIIAGQVFTMQRC